MNGYAAVIKVDGSWTTLDHSPTLEEAQKAVGGLVEMVYAQWMGKPAQVLVNEEGLLHSLPINATVSETLKRPLVGNAVVLTGNYRWK